MDILLDYIDRYYHYDISDESSLAGPCRRGKADNDGPPVSLDSGADCPGNCGHHLIGFFWWRKAKEQKNREAAETERILNTPLDTFGEDSVEDLAKKYQDDPDQDKTE